MPTASNNDSACQVPVRRVVYSTSVESRERCGGRGLGSGGWGGII